MERKKRRKHPSIQTQAEEHKQQVKDEEEEKRKKKEEEEKIIKEQPEELEQSPKKERDKKSTGSKKSKKTKSHKTESNKEEEDAKSNISVPRSVIERKKSNISKPIIKEDKSSTSLPVIKPKKNPIQEEDKKSVKSRITKTSLPIIEDKKSNHNEELPLFKDLIEGPTEDEKLILPPLDFNQRYIVVTESRKPSIKSKKSSHHSKKEEEKKEDNKLPVFQDIITGDPNDQSLYPPPIIYKKENYITPKDSRKNTPTPSVKSKKSIQKKPTTVVIYGRVDPSRVIFEKENQKEQLDSLLCYSCHQYPLDPERCSECKKIFCKNCKMSFKKCPNCNSIYKSEGLPEEINAIFVHAHITCKYKECGCDKELLSNELTNHEELCKHTPIECKDCHKIFIYDTVLAHYEVCPKRNLKKCPVCDYEVREEEFDLTEKKIAHIKHVLLPEITKMVQDELKASTNEIKTIIEKNNEVILQKIAESDRYKDNEALMKQNHEDTIKNMIIIQNMIKMLQATQNEIQEEAKKRMDEELAEKKKKKPIVELKDTLDKKLKSIKLIKEITKEIDNGYECDNKFCILTTFKQDYIIVYPTLRYGIDEYNLSSGALEHRLKNIHESNIICMSYCQNPKSNLTFVASASFDRSIKVFTIENNWKIVTTLKDAHDDYSIFAIDMIYHSEKGVVVISGNLNLQEVKLWYIDEGQSSNNKTIKLTGKVHCVHHNTFDKESTYLIYIGTTEGVFQYNINEIGEQPLKSFIDTETKSKHNSISFIETDPDCLVEGDSVGKVRVWSISKGGMVKTIERGILKYQINSLSPWNEKVVIGGTRDGKVLLFNIEDGEAVDSIGFHSGYVYCVKVAEHWKYGRIIVSCGFDGCVKVWGTM